MDEMRWRHLHSKRMEDRYNRESFTGAGEVRWEGEEDTYGEARYKGAAARKDYEEHEDVVKPTEELATTTAGARLRSDQDKGK